MHVLVVEDDDSLRSTLHLGLEAEGFTVAAAAGSAAAMSLLARRTPDLAVVDINLPDASGFSLIPLLKEKGVLAILLTARSGVTDRVYGFQLGADDYITKPFFFDELVARIRAVSRRPSEPLIPVLRCGDLELDFERQVVTRAGEIVELTRKEYELLHLLLRHADQVLERSVILERVWGSGEFMSNSTLDMYVNYLRKKLEAHGPRILHTVRGVGYVLRCS